MTSASATSNLLCRVHGRLCAIALANVVETMRPLPVEPLAASQRFVLGIAIIRGSPVPVVDLGMLISSDPGARNRFVTVTTGERRVALAVDGVLGIVTLDPESLSRLPPLLRDASGDVVDAVGSLDSELLLVLRSARIVPDEVFANPAGRTAA